MLLFNIGRYVGLKWIKLQGATSHITLTILDGSSFESTWHVIGALHMDQNACVTVGPGQNLKRKFEKVLLLLEL